MLEEKTSNTATWPILDLLDDFGGVLCWGLNKQGLSKEDEEHDVDGRFLMVFGTKNLWS